MLQADNAIETDATETHSIDLVHVCAVPNRPMAKEVGFNWWPDQDCRVSSGVKGTFVKRPVNWLSTKLLMKNKKQNIFLTNQYIYLASHLISFNSKLKSTSSL